VPPIDTSKLLVNPIPGEQFSTSAVKKLQAQMMEIDAKRVDGKFLTESGEVAAGNDEVVLLLERCLKWVGIVLERWARTPLMSHQQNV